MGRHRVPEAPVPRRKPRRYNPLLMLLMTPILAAGIIAAFAPTEPPPVPAVPVATVSEPPVVVSVPEPPDQYRINYNPDGAIVYVNNRMVSVLTGHDGLITRDTIIIIKAIARASGAAVEETGDVPSSMGE